MSASVVVEPDADGAGVWRLRLGQTWEVMRMELGRSRSAWRNLWLPFLAFSPPLIIAGHALQETGCQLEEETLILAAIIQLFYVRFAIFFGCLGIFMRLVGGEVSERTLHYLFLAPVRREVLVLGKFLAGTLTTVVVFGTGIATSVALMYGHFPEGRAFLLDGPGAAHLRAYLLAGALACLGYGAVFLALSLILRNPIVPAIIFLVWEGVNGVLPLWLKRLSVTHHLKPLLPAELPPEGLLALFTVVAEPTPAWVAVTGLLVSTALVLVFACWRIRRLEVSYTSE